MDQYNLKISEGMYLTRLARLLEIDEKHVWKALDVGAQLIRNKNQNSLTDRTKNTVDAWLPRDVCGLVLSTLIFDLNVFKYRFAVCKKSNPPKGLLCFDEVARELDQCASFAQVQAVLAASRIDAEWTDSGIRNRLAAYADVRGILYFYFSARTTDASYPKKRIRYMKIGTTGRLEPDRPRSFFSRIFDFFLKK